MGGKRSPSGSSSSEPVAKKKPPPKKSGGDVKESSKNGKSTATRSKKDAPRSKTPPRKESRREEEKKVSRRSPSARKAKEKDRDRDTKRSRSRRGGGRDAKASGRDRNRSRSRKKERPRSRSRRDRRDDGRDDRREKDRRKEAPAPMRSSAGAGATDSRTLHATNPWAGYGGYTGGYAGWSAGASAGGSWGGGAGGGGGGGKGGGAAFGGNRSEYDEAAFSSFNRTAVRGKDTWMPGRGRNPDLDAERMGPGSARWYSDHDDRRADSEPVPVKRSSSPGKWKHDLFDAVITAPKEPEKDKRFSEKPASSSKLEIDPDAVPAKPGLKVKNKKGRLATVVEGYNDVDFIIKFEDEDGNNRRPIANFTTEDDKPLRPCDEEEKSESKSEDEKEEKAAAGSSKPAADEDKKDDKESRDGDGGDAVVATKGLRVQNKHGRLGVIVKVDPFTIKFDDDSEEKERPMANFFTDSDKAPLKLPDDDNDSDD